MMGPEKTCCKTINSKAQELHNDLKDWKETEDQNTPTMGSVVIYRQIVRRIKYREKGVIAQIGEIKLQNSTQFSPYIAPVET